MAKKIAIVGAHGVGKTVLCKALHEYANSIEKKNELVSEVVRRCPLKLHEGQTLSTTYWITCAQIQAELEAENKDPEYIFCDRSVFDPLMYHIYWFGDTWIDNLLKVAEEYGKTYDRIYLILPSKKEIEPDGFRSTDKAFQAGVNSLFMSYLSGRCGYVESDEIFSSSKRLTKRILEATC